MNTNRICTCLLLSTLLVICQIASADWPQFRGPNGDGSVTATGLPTHWSETENIVWKTEIPLRGWSTPVIMDGQIWLTTATIDGHDFFVIALNEETGRIIFNEQLFHADNPEPLGNNLNCYASPSCAIEPGRVYVHFGTYGTACIDTSSKKTLWKRTDINCRHYRGPGSSVIIYKHLLILTMDGVDVQYMSALDKLTGKTVWKTDRTAIWDDLEPDGKPFDNGDRRKAFATPLIITHKGQVQMLTAGAKAAYAYDPLTGREIWKVAYLGFSGAVSPLYGNDLAYIASGFGRSELLAVRPDGNGEVTDTHIVWQTRSHVPQTPSLVLVDDLLFAVTDNGILTCIDALTGEDIWQQRLKGNFAASLLHADNKIYAADREGTTIVFTPARRYKLLAENKLDDGMMASPAIHNKVLYLRTKTHLYRIQTPQ